MTSETTIQASEALLWLRAYHAETARLGHEAACLGTDIARRSAAAVDMGGWNAWQRDHPETYRAAWLDFQGKCRRHQWLTEELERRATATEVVHG